MKYDVSINDRLTLAAASQNPNRHVRRRRFPLRPHGRMIRPRMTTPPRAVEITRSQMHAIDSGVVRMPKGATLEQTPDGRAFLNLPTAPALLSPKLRAFFRLAFIALACLPSCTPVDPDASPYTIGWWIGLLALVLIIAANIAAKPLDPESDEPTPPLPPKRHVVTFRTVNEIQACEYLTDAEKIGLGVRLTRCGHPIEVILTIPQSDR